MTILTVHPDYAEYLDDWKLIRDAMIGERAIKAAGELYLPMPSGFRDDADNGAALYAAYQKRARFGEYLAPTVAGMVGVIHSSEERAKIELPAQLEYLWEGADVSGQTPLEAWHQALTHELISYGRAAVQVTAAEAGSDPYLALWSALSVVNWDEDLVIFDDSRYERDGFVWKWQERRRVVERRAEGVIFSTVYVGDGTEISTSEIRGVSGSPTRFPVVLVNAAKVGAELVPPPVLGVARAAVSEYQLSADYRWQLYMSGQETMVVINGEAPKAVGAGVVIELRGETDGQQPDAKYVGPAGTGIAAHRVAMEDERQQAIAAGAKLLQFDKQAAESGDALKTRFRGHVATLVGIAQASCRALEQALRVVGELKGLSDDQLDKILVTPPKDLAEQIMSGTEAEAWTRVRDMGGISSLSLYERLQRGGAINPDRSFEEEQELIAKYSAGAVDDTL
jgi:hypothetical protein